MGERAAAYIMRLRDFSCVMHRVCVYVSVQASEHIAHRNTQPPPPSVSVCHIANPLYAPHHYIPPTLSGKHPSAYFHYPKQWNGGNLQRYTHLHLRCAGVFPAGFLIHIFMLHLNLFFFFFFAQVVV